MVIFVIAKIGNAIICDYMHNFVDEIAINIPKKPLNWSKLLTFGWICTYLGANLYNYPYVALSLHKQVVVNPLLENKIKIIAPNLFKCQWDVLRALSPHVKRCPLHLLSDINTWFPIDYVDPKLKTLHHKTLDT